MNIGTLLGRAAARYPETPALTDGVHVRTYAEANRRVSQLASALRARGLSPGDRVAILMRNRPELIEVLFAAFRAGLAAVPINSRLHPDEVQFILAHSKTAALFWGPGLEDSVNVSGPQLVIGPAEYEDLLATGDPSFTDVDLEQNGLAWLFYTSGTTGRPKGAMLTHDNLAQMIVACLANVCDFRPGETVLHVAPLTHGAGLYALAAVARGTSHFVPPLAAFDPGEVLTLIAGQRTSVVSFVTPTMINRLVAESARLTVDTTSLRSVVYGGGPAYVEDLEQAVARFGPVFAQLYGQGESPMTITYLSRDDHLERALLGSVGVPHPTVDVRLVDEADRPVAAGEAGEVCVRGPVVMAGYWNDPDASAETLRGGWLHTGDIGRFSDDGYLFLLDRKKDLIISGGANIYPREVEEILIQHPDVLSGVVIGIPDRVWGESVHAIVVRRAGSTLTERELIEFCRTRIASYKKPKTVEFVEEIPVSGVGKVLKRELRREVLARLGDSSATAGDAVES